MTFLLGGSGSHVDGRVDLGYGWQEALPDVGVQVVLMEGVDVESPPKDGALAANEPVVMAVAE